MERIFEDQTLILLVIVALIAALADAASGVIAAVASGTFTWEYFSEFGKGHLLWKVTPIVLGALFGSVLGYVASSLPNADATLLLAVRGAATLCTIAAVTAAIAYVGAVAGSVKDNVSDMQNKTKGAPSTAVAPQ